MGHHGFLPKIALLVLVSLAIVFGLTLLGLSAGWPGNGQSLDVCSNSFSSAGDKFCAAGAFGIITGAFALIVGAAIIFFAATDKAVSKVLGILCFVIAIFALVALGIWAWGVDQVDGASGEGADITRANLAFAVISFVIWPIIGADIMVMKED